VEPLSGTRDCPRPSTVHPQDQRPFARLCGSFTSSTLDTSIRNLDEHAYRALRSRAVLEGRTVGDLITAYLARTTTRQRSGSLRALKPEPFWKEMSG
jgi:hypothetical protein